MKKPVGVSFIAAIQCLHLLINNNYQSFECRLKQVLAVIFSLSIFSLSISSALANVAVGAIPGEFSVSPGGAATYQIPIEVPPGINGMQPDLALVYNSQSGNGLLGQGWSLSGLSSISRCSKTLARDGVIHGIDFTNADRLCLDGQRLVLVNGNDADDNAYWSASAEYRTEIESFSRVTTFGTGFLVESKDGRTIEYGNTDGSNVNVTIQSSGALYTFTWAANKINDVVGNELTISYIENGIAGHYRVSQIDYNNNKTSISFDYEVRNDVITRYTAGAMYNTSVRMNNIEIHSGLGVVKNYPIEYAVRSGTKPSQVSRVSVCDRSSHPLFCRCER